MITGVSGSSSYSSYTSASTSSTTSTANSKKFADELLKKLDANGDGSIDKDELSSSLSSALSRFCASSSEDAASICIGGGGGGVMAAPGQTRAQN